MTLPIASSRNNYIGNGSTDVYAYTFKIFDEEHLEVVTADEDQVETVLVLNVDYTVSGVRAIGGGSITLLDGDLPLDHAITIRRVVPETQDTDIRNQEDFYASIHEDTFDYLTMIDQQIQDVLNRSLHFKVTSTLTNIPIDDIVAESVLISSADGTTLTWVDRDEFIGPQGPIGPQGVAGEASRWYVQSGVPDPMVGMANDMSLDDTTGDVYRKIVDTWTIEGNILGPVGPTGFGTKNGTPYAPAGTTETIVWGTGNIQTLDPGSASGDVTLTLNSPSVDVARYTILIIQGATPRNVIWPADVLFPQGQAPILSQSNNAIDKVELLWDTANYYGDWNNDYLTT